ncbi:MAG: glutamyl-tRNA reductase [Zoogloeaceae bacterium]|nr:glutamyl-tRNA reductase [Zoogloeaceae bacterium]
MTIFTLGINHHSAPLKIREQVAFQSETLPQALAALMRVKSVREAAILSTCNRTELYCVAEEAGPLADWLAAHHQLPREALAPFLYTLSSSEVARHAFRVASGLDSMVLGEPQILGQMKDAVRLAEAAGTLGVYLNKLFQQAFSVAKEVRSSTAIGAQTVSMAAAAVQLAESIFESIGEQKVLLIGAGEMIELCATHFAARHPQALTVANRTVERGRALAERFDGNAIRLDDLSETLALYDIVVSCTAAPLPIIGLGLVERAIRARRHRPMFMVDLAVPRDIEAEVGALDDVFLYTVDDLAQVVASGVESRQAAATQAQAIIEGEARQFLNWMEARDMVPLIRKLRDVAERARRHELEHAMKRLAAGDAPERVLEQFSSRLTNKFLHAPTEALQHADAQTRRPLQEAATRLFHLSPENPTDDPADGNLPR